MTLHRSLSFSRILALAGVLCAGLASCQRGAAAPAGATRIIPQPPGVSVAPAAGPETPDARALTGAARLRISLDPSDTVLQIVNAKLDQSPYEKQVIAVKRTGDVEAPVRVIVADADPARGTYYYQSWESPTNATDSRVFSLAVTDLVGDHGVEIVASGINSAGKLTIDVFRPATSFQGKELTYKPVCQLIADEISIEETDRPDSYSSARKPGPSFPIVAYLRDPDSQNARDLVRIRYSWNTAEGRYVPGTPAKIPGEKVQQEQLETLYNSTGEDAFEQFISGSWVQVQPAPNAKSSDTFVSIVDFDPRGRKIALSSGNTQEVYLWRESHRTIYNRLLLIGENETVLQIQLMRTFSISVDSVNSITVTIIGSDSGESPTVKYTKVTQNIRARLLEQPEALVRLSALKLAGKYSSAAGVSVDFQNPRLTWTDTKGVRTGTYIIFSLGTRAILSVRLASPGGQREQVRSWLIDYREKRSPSHIAKILSFAPITLTVKGYEDASGESLALEQMQDLGKK
jgi:hypothetical protein